MFTRRHLLPLTAAAVLSAAAVATAEPARTLNLSAAAPEVSWEAGPFDSGGTPLVNPAPRCSPTRPCDDNLLKVADAGTLVVEVKSTGTEPDIDLYLYESNEKGEPVKEIALSDEVSPDEKVSKAVKPGFYLARVVVYSGLDVMYKGVAKLNGATAAPAPASSPDPGAGGSGGSGSTGSGQAAPAGEPALTASVSVPKTKLKTAFSSGVPVKVTCNVSCQGVLRFTLSARDSKRYKVGKKATVLGEMKFTPAAGERTITVKLSSKAAKRLRKAKKLVVSLTAEIADANGAQRRAINQKVTLTK